MRKEYAIIMRMASGETSVEYVHGSKEYAKQSAEDIVRMLGLGIESATIAECVGYMSNDMSEMEIYE